MPFVSASSTAGQLLLRQKHASLGRTLGRRLHGLGVGRSDFVVVMKVLREDRAFYQRRQNLRQEQVGHGAQLIAGCGVPGNVDAESTQLLDQAPYDGAADSDFVRDLRAARNDSSMIHEQANDLDQASVTARGSGNHRPRIGFWLSMGIIT